MAVRPKIVVVGSANIDLVVRAPRMPVKGETILGGPFFSGPGGKGANQTVGAARLGGDVTMVVKLGKDQFGDMALANLKREGVNVEYVLRSAKAHTGVAFIIVDDAGENMIVVASGANALLSPADVEAASGVIRKASVLLVQLESPLETVERAVQLAHEAGVEVILNPAPGRPLGESLLEMVDVLTPNRTEAQILTGMPIDTIGQAESAARALLRGGVGAVALTLGAEGALVVEPESISHVPAYNVRVVDTTGAGDAFNGALAVALAEGQPLLQAVQFASAAAALQVTKEGSAAAMPVRGEVDALLR